MQVPEKIKVLIAEDNPDIGLLLQLTLASKGIEAVWVSDGVEALERIEHQQPDLLLTDIDMPRKDGITLIKDVRQQEISQQSQHHLPIVVMSGGGEEKLRDAARAGAAFCFSKPFIDLAKVIDKIKELLHTPLITDSVCSTA